MKNILRDVHALLTSHPINIRYLTGFIGAAPEEREAYALVTPEKIYLFASALYLEEAKKIIQLSNKQINTNNPIKEVIEISRDNPLTTHLSEILKLHSDSPSNVSLGRKESKLGFEETDLTVAEYNQLKERLDEVTLVPTRDRIENVRMFKSPEEIKNIKQAVKLTDDCFSYILTILKPGVSETDIAWEIETYFKKHGAQNAFSPIVAFGKNASHPHYQPTSSFTLNPSPSLVLLDFGARVNGYCADMTRMVFVGKPHPEIEKAYTSLKLAQETALNLLQKGERSGAILDAKVREVLVKHDFPSYPHSLGHALGLAIHELPRLSEKQDMILQPGMVATIEPGIYAAGKYGMRIEDVFYVTEKNEVEVLSKSSKELLVL